MLGTEDWPLLCETNTAKCVKYQHFDQEMFSTCIFTQCGMDWSARLLLSMLQDREKTWFDIQDLDSKLCLQDQ